MRRSKHVFYKAIGLILAILAAGFGAFLGWLDEMPRQIILLSSLAIFGLVIWGWHHVSVRWVHPSRSDRREMGESLEASMPEEAAEETGYLRELVSGNKSIFALIIAGVIAFFAAGAVVEGFFQPRNLLAVLVFVLFIIGAFVLNRFVTVNKSAFFGLVVLLGLFIVGSLVVEGFLSAANIKSMLVFASFLGLASVGQTLVALMGGLDLSIPFVIGSSNIILMWLFTVGVPPVIAIIIVILMGGVIGLISGFLSFRLQGQALILTLGVGFAVTGAAQIVTSVGSDFGGTVFGVVPSWMTNIAAMNGKFFGLPLPPVILIWILFSAILIIGQRHTSYGRGLYALGGSRTAAERLLVSERSYWVGAYTLSGLISAFTGVLLLGWSGGGFVGVGDPYLFMTLAAVVVGGTSLLGGWGGYGFTVIGVLVLQVLTSFLVGIGLDFEGQQFVFGLLILPMVALYARSPHISTQI